MIRSFFWKPLALCAAFVAVSAPCRAQEIVVQSAKVGGVYTVGEKIVWHVEVKGEGATDIGKISYVLRKGALAEIKRGELVLQNGAADLETRLDEPGSILAELKAAVPGKSAISGLAGAVIEPQKIGVSAPRPADFDAFWNSKIEELHAVPANPVLEAGQSGDDDVDYWKITLDNIRGSKVRGHLARPKTTGKKLPALLLVQYAGVYPLQKSWVTARAREGWLTLDINAHDLPIDSPADFYTQQRETVLKDYPAIGNDSRETSYFLRMYLSCYRAADYLAGRDDWDGKTLVVMGSSQGGLQAIMTGGLHPQISAVLANVPAGCDHTGPLVGRRGGWPQWFDKTGGKDAAKVIETSRYFDVVNFASRVKGPSLVAAGLIDTTCPVAGVAAAFNQIPAPKQLVVMEHADHQGRNGSHTAFYEQSKIWLQRLAQGTSLLEPQNPMKIQSPTLAASLGATILLGGAPQFQAPAQAQTPVQLPAGASPSQGVNQLQNGDFASDTTGWTLVGGSRLQSEFVPATAGPFTRAIRFSVAPQAGDKPWAAALLQKLPAPLRNGEKFTLRFWARSPQSLVLGASVESARSPYSGIARQRFTLSPDWHEFSLEGTPAGDFARGEAQLIFPLASGTGVIEMAGVRLESGAATTQTPERVPVTAVVPLPATLAEGAINLLSNGDFAAPLAGNWVASGPIKPQVEIVKPGGQPNGITQVLRMITSVGADSKTYDARLGQRSLGNVAKGDLIVVRAWLRSPDSTPVSLHFQPSTPPFNQTIGNRIELSPQWREVRLFGLAKGDYAAGESRFDFHCGLKSGTVEVANVRVENYGKTPRAQVEAKIGPQTKN